MDQEEYEFFEKSSECYSLKYANETEHLLKGRRLVEYIKKSKAVLKIHLSRTICFEHVLAIELKGQSP